MFIKKSVSNLILILVSSVQSFALGQNEAQVKPSHVIAANIDGVPVYVADVERLVQRFPQQPAEGQVFAAQQAVALEQLIHRRLVCIYLESQGIGAGKSEIDLEQESLEITLEQRGVIIGDYLKQTGLTLESLRMQWEWQIGWRKYLNRFLTEENLQKYFEQNKRQFDGTQLRVSHLLISIEKNSDESEWEKAITKCATIRKEIVDKTITWENAVSKYSTAASANEKGDAGWISFLRPMPRDFTDAAFELDVDEISLPVRTAFGVHLLKINDVRAGNKTWRDARVELERAATRYLFDRIVDLQIKKSKVEFTGNSPYFEIGSGKLVRQEK